MSSNQIDVMTVGNETHIGLGIFGTIYLADIKTMTIIGRKDGKKLTQKDRDTIRAFSAFHLITKK